MSANSRRCHYPVILGALFCAGTALAQGGAAHDWSGVNQALGRVGATQPGDVIKYGFPRTDLSVTVRGVPMHITPSLRMAAA